VTASPVLGIAGRGRIGARGGGRLRNLAPDAEASVAFGQSSPPATAALRSVHGRLWGLGGGARFLLVAAEGRWRSWLRRSRDALRPCRSAPLSSEEGLPRHAEALLPNDEALLPNDEALLPNDEALLPNDEALLPNDEALLPNDEALLTPVDTTDPFAAIASSFEGRASLTQLRASPTQVRASLA